MKRTESRGARPPRIPLPMESHVSRVSNRRDSQVLGIVVLAVLLLLIAGIRFYL